ncbi:MAG: serine/threonine-protein phosphatase [Candidatus Eisenbacteria bacterium]|uniref:Serine/threonine-protein phosphatase n=1 Tax=Eiseniibacteriota bacterium TaxID=2212470 RepID=A0A956N7R8_UNCEI|nr:serine/threonine-protein phosphatase [Candidatus Eisenbacteria bacterium]
MKLNILHRSHVGRVRELNEDAYAIWRPPASSDADCALLAIADGMGGHPGGEIASRLAVEAVEKMVPTLVGKFPSELLTSSFQFASHQIKERATAEPEYGEMGTTLTCVWYQDGHAYVGHVGDTRLYWFREDRWVQVTVDHTMAQDLVDAGRLEPEEADEHPTSHVLTRCLGVCPRQSPDILHGSLALQDGDTLLLATDGLGKTVHDETLAEMIGKVGPEQACDWMIEAALAAGAPDNVTVILARAEGDAPFAPAYGGPKHQLDGSPARFSWDFGI